MAESDICSSFFTAEADFLVAHEDALRKNFRNSRHPPDRGATFVIAVTDHL